MGALARLFDFKGGSLAVADQVDEEFDNLVQAIEGVAAGAAGVDSFQAGVVAATDFVLGGVTFAVAAGTGKLAFDLSNGAAWMPGPSGALVRVFTPAATYGLTPPALPGPGAFRKIGVELTASGDTTVVSMVSGPEEISEALAIANSPAVSAGKVRIFDYVLQNSVGVYSTHAGRDRRPWALGAYSAKSGASLNQRFEFTGVPVQVMVCGPTLSSVLKVVIKLDGATVYEVGEEYATVTYAFTPAAGSHMVETIAKHTSEAATSVLVIVRELVRQNANNGTA